MTETVTLAARPLRVQWIEREPGICTRSLRRYRAYSENRPCACDESVFIGEFPGGETDGYLSAPSPSVYESDPRWPAVCSRCGRAFEAEDEWQVFVDHVYRNAATGQRAMLRQWEKIAGAMWDAWWLREDSRLRGPDGRCLIVVCPDGNHWMVDGRASNCTMPDDHEHKCWTRRGEPPDIDVAKHYGPTCQAGAGSILTPHWHGFLRNGWLVDC